MDYDDLRKHKKGLTLAAGVLLISLSVFVSFFHTPTAIFIFAGGGILLMSLLGEE